MPLQRATSVICNLNELSGFETTNAAKKSVVETEALTLAKELSSTDQIKLNELLQSQQPKLATLRRLLIQNGRISTVTLEALASAIHIKDKSINAEPCFVKIQEFGKVCYPIMQPTSIGKTWQTIKYQRKYGIEIDVESRPMGQDAIDALLSKVISGTATKARGVILRSFPDGQSSLTSLGDDYRGHVTPFIIQKTSHGFDVICLDSVNQPDNRLFISCRKYVSESVVIRTMTSPTPRQADGHSCHTDALQVLKDILGDFGRNASNVYDSLIVYSTALHPSMNPVDPNLPAPRALSNSPVLNKVAQLNNSGMRDKRYWASLYDNERCLSKPMNQYLLLKGFHNALSCAVVGSTATEETRSETRSPGLRPDLSKD